MSKNLDEMICEDYVQHNNLDHDLRMALALVHNVIEHAPRLNGHEWR